VKHKRSFIKISQKSDIINEIGMRCDGKPFSVQLEIRINTVPEVMRPINIDWCWCGSSVNTHQSLSNCTRNCIMVCLFPNWIYNCHFCTLRSTNTPRIRRVRVGRTRVGVGHRHDTDTYNYIELCHFLSTCRCPYHVPYLCHCFLLILIIGNTNVFQFSAVKK
jgi:hypothetical protein